MSLYNTREEQYIRGIKPRVVLKNVILTQFVQLQF